jgi:hypothetical protein
LQIIPEITGGDSASALQVGVLLAFEDEGVVVERVEIGKARIYLTPTHFHYMLFNY